MTARGTKQKDGRKSSEWERQEERFTTRRQTKIRIRERPGREENASVVTTLGKGGSALLLCHKRKELGVGFLTVRMKEISSNWQE